MISRSLAARLLIGAALAGGGCGPSTPKTSVSVTGTVGGMPFTAGDGAATSSAINSSGAWSAPMLIDITAGSQACDEGQDADKNVITGNAVGVVLTLDPGSGTAPLGLAIPIGGECPLPGQDCTATARLYDRNSACKETLATSDWEATSGSVTITAATALQVQGKLNLMFGSDDLSGTFTVDLCAFTTDPTSLENPAPVAPTPQCSP